MDSKIIPFGKHKGKPIEILASDKQYSDWLISQSWFKERHVNLYNVVINNFREPVDTPEHNKMQIKFLKLEYRLKLAYYVNQGLFNQNSDKINKAMLEIVNSDNSNSKYFISALVKPNRNDEFGLYERNLLRYSEPVFERIDVSYSFRYGIQFYYDNGYEYGGYSQFRQAISSSYWIEIKPTVSDDFPAVLRQMKASMPVKLSEPYKQNFFILLIGDYTGIGATKEEFVEYFRTQGYRVVFENEFASINVPIFEREFKLDPEIENKMAIE